jgi:hypothetical protein
MNAALSRSTFTLANRDDARREIHLAVLVVPVLPWLGTSATHAFRRP